jgi:hypothetical protein
MLLLGQLKNVVMLDYGVNATGEAVYLDFAAAIIRYGTEQAKIQNIHKPIGG